ncbi:MAG: serine/threonine-protein kinase, partial [Victivallales bacterium]
EQLIGKPLSKEDIQEQLMHRAEQSPGIILGDFLLIKKVGEGGFAIVYEGVQLGIGRRVAVKVLRDGNSPEVISRFQREAEHLSRYEGNASIVDVITCQKDPWLCPHGVKPQDIPLIEEFESGTRVRHYMALEWIDGETLDQVFAHPPKTSRIVEMFLGVTDALIAIHTDNLVHRDIKPANIMVDKEGKVKLMDFGIALENDPGRSIVTKVGTVLGTPAYMSPEQINAQLVKWQVGPASDIYSLGITFFELFTGTRCMNHDKHTTGEIRDLKRTMTRIDIPPCGLDWSLRAILAGCLEPDVEDRYKSAQQLRDDLVRYLNNESILYRKPPFIKRIRLAYKRNTFAFHVGIVAVSLIAMLTSYHIFALNQTLIKVEKEKADKEKALIKIEKEKARTEEALKRVKKYSLRALSAQGKISQLVSNVDLSAQYVLALVLTDLFQPGDEDYLLSDTDPVSAIGCVDAVLNRCLFLYQSGKYKELEDWCDRGEIIFAKAYKIAGEPISKEVEHMRVRLIWNRAAGKAMEEKYPEAIKLLDESDKVYDALQALSDADIKVIAQLMIDATIVPRGTSLEDAIENQIIYRKLQRLLTKKMIVNMRLLIACFSDDNASAIKVFKEIIPLYESILEITPEDIMTRFQMLSQYFLVGSMANNIDSDKVMSRYKELKSEYLTKGLLSKEYVEMLDKMEKGLKE